MALAPLSLHPGNTAETNIKPDAEPIAFLPGNGIIAFGRCRYDDRAEEIKISKTHVK